VFPKYFLFYVFFLLLLVSGCRHLTTTPETIDSYYLQYEIKYLEEMAGDIPTKLLPRKMDAYYSKHYVYTRIDGFFNQFTLVQIADLKRNRISTLLDFFGTHVCYTGSKGELPAAVMELEGLEIRFTKDTVTLGGFLSERIEVETTDNQYDIYYTPDIKVRHPNISTPYTMVKYPLTSFRIQLSHLKMHLTCKKSEYKPVDYAMFSVPEEYKQVNRAAMEEIINNLFTKD